MKAADIVVTLGEKRRVEAQVRGHRLVTDQPVENGGDDFAPSPFEFFLASIGTCAGLFVQAFCARRGIDPTDIQLVERPVYSPEGALHDVAIEVRVPPNFPAQYREAVALAAAQCTVKKAIAAQPTISVTVKVNPTEGVQPVESGAAAPSLGAH